ncbi:MAG: DUF1156 domain-containing protein, partial [Candidatus Staskawiczbacteria bacterium]|nr:DUF1156 domain-containing protein [Candidatus Staskawiczbacteria bacterium]
MIERRFIEEYFPLNAVGESSISEGGKDHIKSIHVWWARRPLAASRASIYSSLILFNKNENNIEKTSEFIQKLSDWKNSVDHSIIFKARKEILKQFNNLPPRILDPFSGGGAIPLEALRLGCETYASDYNPISVFLLKCTLEYPQKFASITDENFHDQHTNKLIKIIEFYGKKILEKVSRESEQFYPKEKNSFPYAYFWSRVIKCQNPNCQAEIPLFTQYWLSKKRNVSLYPKVQKNKIIFSIVGKNYAEKPANFDPNNGSVYNAVATCSVCSFTVDDTTTRKLIFHKNFSEKLIAVCLLDNKGKKLYRLANENDIKIFENIGRKLTDKQNELIKKWNILPINEFVDTPTHNEYQEGGLFYNFFPIVLYGFTKWGDLFNSRQKYVLLLFIDAMREIYLEIKNEMNENDAKIIISYLTLAFNRLLTRYNNVTVWHSGSEQTEKIFAIQAIPMKWYYPEANPLITDNATSFQGNLKSVLNVLENLIKIPKSPIHVEQSSATSLNYQDEFFDAVITDPPYYDMVPYSALSDFFYVWDKRILSTVFPELFSTHLTPKTLDAIADLP